MKVLIKDPNSASADINEDSFDRVICADGRYSPCQGCFKCWTKHPATCAMKDSLHEVCRVIGLADDLVIVTVNLYGGFSPAVKNILDRAIGVSTPMSTYRGRQMHHTLRYGKRGMYRVIVTGDVSAKEKETWSLMAERNALNWGYTAHEVVFADTDTVLKEAAK